MTCESRARACVLAPRVWASACVCRKAIRKRTRAGMGNCQGDVDNYDCEARVAAIIARETGLQVGQVGRRPWPGSSMMHKRVLDEADSARLVQLSDPSKEYTLHGAA
jgi:hypothetical protein